MHLFKRLALPVVLLATASVAVFASSALAGAKPYSATAYDPTHHAAVSSNTINLYSFRWLTARTPLTMGYVPTDLRGHGLLAERKPWSPACHALHSCVRRMKVQFMLTRPISCLPQDVFEKPYSHLYVRPYGATHWRELLHYHEVVKADCR